MEVQSLRGRLLREWNVMQWLANPYITAVCLMYLLNKILQLWEILGTGATIFGEVRRRPTTIQER